MRINTAKDVSAGRFVVRLRNAQGVKRGLPGSHVSEVVLCAGTTPGYAFYSSPMKNFGAGAYDEIAPTCALQKTGPAGNVKLLERACVLYAEGRNTHPVLNGWVVSHSHQLEEDSIVSQIFDDRFVLGKFTVFGRMSFDPSISADGLHYWDSTQPTRFNDLGYPNCLDTQWGPRFAPCHRFGYQSDFGSEEYSEPEAGAATTRARSWTVADAVRYLRDMFVVYDGSRRPTSAVDLGSMSLPEGLQWEQNLLQNLAGGVRPLMDLDVTNMSLLDALGLLGRKAGAYDLIVTAKSEFKSELRFADMNPRDNTGLSIQTANYAASHVGQALNITTIVKSGHCVESAINYFHDTCVMGDPPAIEMMCSMEDSSPGALFLEPAWSTADEAAFKIFVADYEAAGNEAEGFEIACRRWPLVYAAYRVPRSKTPWAGTKWNGNQNANYMRILPAQLSGYQMSGANPRNWQPREIVAEYRPRESEFESPTADDWKWRVGDKYDNLTLSADRTIVILDALRANRKTYGIDYHEDGGGTYDSTWLNAEKRKIRIQLALEADWPLTGRYGQGAGAAQDPNQSAERVAQTDRFTWATVAGNMDYTEYLRRADSRPMGEAGWAALDLNRIPSTRVAEGSELFTDRVNATSGRLPRHAELRLMHVKRVEYNALLEIARPALWALPGNPVSLEAGGDMPFRGVLKSVRHDGNVENSWLEMGPPDSASIYDLPNARRAVSASNLTTAVESPKLPPKRDEYESDNSGGKQAAATPAPVITSANDPAPAAVAAKPGGAVIGPRREAARTEGPGMAANSSPGDTPTARKAERQLRQDAVRSENRAAQKADKKQQRAGNTQGREIGFFERQGKRYSRMRPSAGNVRGGQPGGAPGLYGQREVAEHDKKQYLARNAAENARVNARNAAAAVRQRAYEADRFGKGRGFIGPMPEPGAASGGGGA